MKLVKCGIAVILCSSLSLSSSFTEAWTGFGSHLSAPPSTAIEVQALAVPANTFPGEGFTKTAALIVDRGAIPLRLASDPRSGRASVIFTLIFGGGLVGLYIAYYLYYFAYGNSFDFLLRSKKLWWDFYLATQLGIPLTFGLIVSAIAALWSKLHDFDEVAYDRTPRKRLYSEIFTLLESHEMIRTDSFSAKEGDWIHDYDPSKARNLTDDILTELVEIGLTDQQALFVTDKILGSAAKGPQVTYTENRDIQSNELEGYTMHTTVGPLLKPLEEALNELIDFRKSKSAALTTPLSSVRKNLIAWIEEARKIQKPPTAPLNQGGKPSPSDRRGFGGVELMGGVGLVGLWGYSFLIGILSPWILVLVAGEAALLAGAISLHRLISDQPALATIIPASRSPALSAA